MIRQEVWAIDRVTYKLETDEKDGMGYQTSLQPIDKFTYILETDEENGMIRQEFCNQLTSSHTFCEKGGIG